MSEMALFRLVVGVPALVWGVRLMVDGNFAWGSGLLGFFAAVAMGEDRR